MDYVYVVSNYLFIEMTQNQVDQSSMQFMGEVEQLHKGTWVQEEDERLIYFVQLMGDKKWDSLAKASGLRRSGKSCRLRWLNYLRPNLKRGQISVEEENIILQLHEKWGNKWSKIARRLPGRTDNEIKNYWRSCLRKKNNSNIAQQAQESHEVQNNEGKEELLLYDENKNESISNSSPSDNKQDISCEDYSWISSSSSEFELANNYSPYENRFKDWISKYYSLNDQQQSEVNNQNESCNNNSVVGVIDDESCWSNSLDYNSYCTWEYSGSLWDVN